MKRILLTLILAAGAVPAWAELEYTQVYLKQGEQERPVYDHQWYRPETYLGGIPGEDIDYLVHLAPMPRGNESANESMAIAFYKHDKALKAYSVRDLAGRRESITIEQQPYEVFGERLGFRRFGGRMFFDIRDLQGDVLTFDADTGELLD